METYKKYLNEGLGKIKSLERGELPDGIAFGKNKGTDKGDMLDSKGTKKVLFLKNGSISIKAGKSQIMLNKQEAEALLRSLKRM
jgi:hypothetical protein